MKHVAPNKRFEGLSEPDRVKCMIVTHIIT